MLPKSGGRGPRFSWRRTSPIPATETQPRGNMLRPCRGVPAFPPDQRSRGLFHYLLDAGAHGVTLGGNRRTGPHRSTVVVFTDVDWVPPHFVRPPIARTR